MPTFDIKEMFRGVDKKWVKVLTSKTLMPLLSSALDNLGKIDDIKTITPPPNQIFNFARVTPYDSVKVVILGQDPYPKKGDAHGLAFSSLCGLDNRPPPASLRNIYKCLHNHKLIDSIPNTSDLTGWASQGVLLLNASLTTTVGKANAHASLWKDFTDGLIKYISNDDTCGPVDSLTFMLWGNFAQKKIPLINEDCVILQWLHPSPLAQNVGDDKKFLKCTHFIEVNNLLTKEMGLTPIDWNPVIKHIVFTDGACSNNGKGIFSKAGYSVYFSKGPLVNTITYGKVPPAILNGAMVYGTNQRGEGLGIIRAFELIVNCGIKANTTLVTDSNFWKDMIEVYMPKWDAKGISFNTKKNHDMTTRLYAITKKVMDLGVLEIIHVASHNKDPNADPEHVRGNAIVDDYANKAKDLDNHDEITVSL